jgi:hypothetical protein
VVSVEELEDLRGDLEGQPESDLRRLIERAHLIEQMTAHPGWPFFADYIASLTVRIQRYVLSGECKTLDEYAAKTGYVRGLQEAVDAPAKLLKQVSLLQAEYDEANV